jgi:hypothetical protein
MIALIVALAGGAAPSLGQTAPAGGSMPSVGTPPPTSAAGAVVQAQLAAPARPGRVGGNEASAIYKRYLDGIGRPMPLTQNYGSGVSGSSMGRGGGQ